MWYKIPFKTENFEPIWFIDTKILNHSSNTDKNNWAIYTNGNKHFDAFVCIIQKSIQIFELFECYDRRIKIICSRWAEGTNFLIWISKIVEHYV